MELLLEEQPNDDLLTSNSALQRGLQDAGLLDDNLLDNLNGDSPLLSKTDNLKSEL